VRRLLIGYGNPGRGDDALGPRLAEALAAEKLPDLDVAVDFQLNVENAFDLRGYDAVYFVDACVDGPAPYLFRRIAPRDPPVFSSHAASPEGVLALAKRLFDIDVPGYVLAVRGYAFDEFGAPLSPAAEQNYHQALAFLRDHLRSSDSENAARVSCP
jgi:hydrogenase maturation protease